MGCTGAVDYAGEMLADYYWYTVKPSEELVEVMRDLGDRVRSVAYQAGLVPDIGEWLHDADEREVRWQFEQELHDEDIGYFTVGVVVSAADEDGGLVRVDGSDPMTPEKAVKYLVDDDRSYLDSFRMSQEQLQAATPSEELVAVMRDLGDRVRSVAYQAGLSAWRGGHWYYDEEAREATWRFKVARFTEDEARELVPDFFKRPDELGYDYLNPDDMEQYEREHERLFKIAYEWIGVTVSAADEDGGLVRVDGSDPMTPDAAVRHILENTTDVGKLQRILEPPAADGLGVGGDRASQRRGESAPAVGLGRVEAGAAPRVGDHEQGPVAVAGPELGR